MLLRRAAAWSLPLGVEKREMGSRTLTLQARLSFEIRSSKYLPFKIRWNCNMVTEIPLGKRSHNQPGSYFA